MFLCYVSMSCCYVVLLCYVTTSEKMVRSRKEGREGREQIPALFNSWWVGFEETRFLKRQTGTGRNYRFYAVSLKTRETRAVRN